MPLPQRKFPGPQAVVSLVKSETARTLRLSSFLSKVTPLALSPQPSELLFYICCGLLCWGSLDCKSPAHHQLPKIPRAPLVSEGPLAHGVDPEPHPILPLPATASQASRKSLQHNSPAAKFPGPSLWLSS